MKDLKMLGVNKCCRVQIRPQLRIIGSKHGSERVLLLEIVISDRTCFKF